MNRLLFALLAFAPNLIVLQAGCQPTNYGASDDDGRRRARDSGDIAPPHAPRSGLPPELPERRDNCTRDDECGLFNGENERVGKADGPAGCCLNSVIPYARAANKDWLTQLDQFCASRPPGPCPGGNGPPVKAVCRAGHCEVVH